MSAKISGEETLEQWAARVAPTLTDKQWREAEQMAKDLPAGRGDSGDEARALLAYRDNVAAGLSPAMRRDLPREWTWPYPSPATAGALQRRGLLVPGTWERTDFGREIARVLCERSPMRGSWAS